MKKVIILLSLLGASLVTHASPALMIGVSLSFNGDFGITGKVISSDKEDKAIAALGATYYPNAAKKLGIDLSAGYTKSNVAGTIGWDFLQKNGVGSLGYVNTKKTNSTTRPGGTGGGTGGTGGTGNTGGA